MIAHYPTEVEIIAEGVTGAATAPKTARSAATCLNVHRAATSLRQKGGRLATGAG
jgi:hypothetical protein